MPDSKPHRDDLLIGDDEWIKYVQHDWANVKWHNIDKIIAPLAPLLELLELHCVAECCGLDAFSFHSEDILAVAAKLDRKTVIDALNHAAAEISQLENDVLGSKRLNNGIDRGTMLKLLYHI